MNPSVNPSSADSPVQPGTILAGKYRVDRVIGRGGMGIVVEAHHVALDERVALKFLMPDFAQQPEARERFLREGRAAAKIKGEHVARVSDVGELENGAPYMVMEFLDGIDLSRALQQYGVCQIPDAIDYLLQACEAIAEAHVQGIVHRDLKPANLFLSKRPDGSVMVKVLDFGISKMAGGVDNLTKTTTSMGSALYMSPEQMQMTRGVDHRTDIYALGITLYELLAGKQPYYAETLPTLVAQVLTGEPSPIWQLRPDVPEGLGAALEKAYARDRDQRYQTIAELSAGLAPFAPPRSQPTLDCIARMAGLPPPIAGSGMRQTSRPSSDLAIQGVMAAAAYAPSKPEGEAEGAEAFTVPPLRSPSGVPLLISGYDGPMSSKAAAAFAVGPAFPPPGTGTNLSLTSPRSASSKTGLIVVMAVVMVALLAGSAVLWLRMHSAATPQEIGAPPTAPSPSLSAPSVPSVPSVEPTATAPEPSATQATPPQPTASAATSATAAPGVSPGTRPKAPPTKPTGSTKKPTVMDSR